MSTSDRFRTSCRRRSSVLRLVGALIIMTACTALGFFFAGRLRLRKEYLGALLMLSDSLKTEIRYSRDDIMTLIRRSSPRLINELAPKTDNAVEFRTRFSDGVPRSYSLTPEDRALTDELFSKLGTTDVEGQISHLELCGEKLRNSYNNSIEEIKTKSKLYKLLGFFAGAALAVTVL